MGKMNKIFKIFFVLLVFFNLQTSSNSKPVPPGAGEGDVAANILFLVDSSASMAAWIGNDGLDSVPNAVYDSAGRIIVTQSRGNGVIRYTYNNDADVQAYERDRSFGNNGGIRFAGTCRQVLYNNGRTGTNQRMNVNVSRNRNVKSVRGLTTSVLNNENLIFFNSTVRRTFHLIFAFDETGRNCRMVLDLPEIGTVRGFDVKTINNVPYIFALGTSNAGRRNGSFVSCNLETLMCETQRFGRGGWSNLINSFSRMSVNNEGTMLYLGNGNLNGYSLTRTGNAFTINENRVRFCARTNQPTLDSQLINVTSLAVSPDDSNIIYVGSGINFAIQKVQVSDTGCTVLSSIGKGIRSFNKNEPATGSTTIAAGDVNFSQVWGLEVDAANSRILTSTSSGFIDEFNEDLFTNANRDTAWLENMGGPRINRWTGVKQAIDAIVNDTTLTTGAHFGFGHWNAGESGRGKNSRRGGRHCHRNDGCMYYRGWVGSHPEGTSRLCNTDSCINVGISSQGAGRIMSVLRPLGLAWGTDANAFSQMAQNYFNDGSAGGLVFDPTSECQLNYVIVIGDGAMRNTGPAQARIAALRQQGIKTLFVAYGGNIRGSSMRAFERLATAGSCGADGSDECEDVIVANTPEDLKSELTSKIRQIIADKLAFTAPSITATIQEGGSLYQAQFGYEQFKEWRGKILRKKLKANGDVIHEMGLSGNWNAAVEMRAQSRDAGVPDARNLWTAMPTVPYIGNWDNFTTENSDAIGSLFESLNYTVKDYHDGATGCNLGSNGNADDIVGLINFMSGVDYFDYDGDCNINEKRDSVMGDVYHSQLVEVGKPDANVKFEDNNQEAYWRAKNNYQSFAMNNFSRKSVIYAGANSGVLHAIDAETGQELWGFIPPFVAGLLPQVINKNYNGKVNGTNGGSNPIFGVDGSPVIHDVFIKGISPSGAIETRKSWHTILFIPYGRGGAGFSVLDVTQPQITGTGGPIHMFSIYNDNINKRILIADHEGNITQKTYNSGFASSLQSQEGIMAQENYNAARAEDEGNQTDVNPEVTTQQDAIAPCDDSEDFRINGTASCFKGTTFYFDGIVLDYNEGDTIPAGVLSATEIEDGEAKSIPIASATMEGGSLKVTFNEEKVININVSDAEPTESNQFSISTACRGATGIEPMYDYTQLGETWSSPRIFRIPSANPGKRDNVKEDTYVAVMGGGLSLNDPCAGSAVFLVNLEDRDNPGSIFGAEENGGPISIVDTDPGGVTVGNDVLPTPNGSDINNSIPSTPLVITPDTAFGIPWRGAMVYVNDLEGKITKINLTSSEENGAELFDQTTLFKLNADTSNARYSYFSMDAGIGFSDSEFWLFGSTGNFTDLGSQEAGLDNILYGVKDPDFPLFNPNARINGGAHTKTPSGSDETFLTKANLNAEQADTLDDAVICNDVTGDVTGDKCPTKGKKAWYIALDRDSNGSFISPRQYRKASAPPTLFSGKVYFPVYQPPVGQNRCNQGKAYICVTDDECGTNKSQGLQTNAAAQSNNDLGTDTSSSTGSQDTVTIGSEDNACAYINEGVLSELVVFGTNLFANVAGPSADASTLYRVPALPGDIISNRGGWRDSSY